MKMRSVLLLCNSLMLATQLCGSAGQAALAAQSACAESATPKKPLSTLEFSFPENPTFNQELLVFPVGRGVGIGRHSLVFSEDGSRLGVGNLGESPITVSAFDVNKETGMLREIEGSPFQQNRSPIRVPDRATTIAPSANKKWIAIQSLNTTNNGSYYMQIDIVQNRENKDLQQLLKTSEREVHYEYKKIQSLRFPLGWNFSFQYSPDSRLFAVSSSVRTSTNITSFVFMYEVDQETGKISPITGDLLKVVRPQKEYQEAHKTLLEPTPPLVTKEVVESVLQEYIVGPQQGIKQESIKEMPEKTILKKEKTDKEPGK